MECNYHTHTYLCNHASGTIEQYVQEAIKNGLKILGFSDHVPVPFSNGHRSTFRMDTHEIEIYVNEVLRLKESYKDKIQILLGYEMEYYYKEFDATMNLIKQFPCDYLILGQHWTNNEYDGAYCGAVVSEENFKQYVKQVIDAINTGVFSYIAHPDLINYRENDKIYIKEMTKLCEAAKAKGIPLEFNILGFVDGRNYPCNTFWKLVSDVGNEVIIGSDAHYVEAVGNPVDFTEANKWLNSCGIKPIDKLKLRDV